MLGAVTLLGHRVIADVFSADQAVVAAAAGALIWVAAGQPVAGQAFALDGILVGAGDLLVPRRRHAGGRRHVCRRIPR
ncbi:MAG: hypothetical protein R2704_17670 [Microthrixaceae bacterium]